MSKLLLILAGKDAELESVLVERDQASSNGSKDGETVNASPLSRGAVKIQGLSVTMKDLGGNEIVFDLHDGQGHSVELALALGSQKNQTEQVLNSRTDAGFFAALAAEIASPEPPREPMSLDALQEAKSRRHAAKRPQWSRALALRGLQNEAERAVLILRGMLQLAVGDPLVPLARLRLQSVLSRTVTGHKHHYPERTIELRQRSRHLALGSSQRVDLAVSLLLDNAEKYTPPSQPLEIDCFDGSSTCSIALMDNSPYEHLERFLGMWDLYDAGQDDPDQLAVGSGISLSVGRQLVESMHGEIWYGRRKDGGNAFVINLPRARPTARRPANVVSLYRNPVSRHYVRRGITLATRGFISEHWSQALLTDRLNQK